MVLPFTTLDEALGTIDMLGRDPGISEIRAVVVDLRERSLDDGFGAAALEQILETIESWNAQSLITGVSPSSESAIASLEASHLVLRKDLGEAIATAFQIADAQKHLL
jgi:anti-anti-sigma regulatory factor